MQEQDRILEALLIAVNSHNKELFDGLIVHGAQSTCNDWKEICMDLVVKLMMHELSVTNSISHQVFSSSDNLRKLHNMFYKLIELGTDTGYMVKPTGHSSVNAFTGENGQEGINLISYAWGKPKKIPLICLINLIHYLSGGNEVIYDSDFENALTDYSLGQSNIALVDCIAYFDNLITTGGRREKQHIKEHMEKWITRVIKIQQIVPDPSDETDYDDPIYLGL